MKNWWLNRVAKEQKKEKDAIEKANKQINTNVNNLNRGIVAFDKYDDLSPKELVKKIKGQLVKHPFAKKTFGVKVDKNQYNKSLEFLMKNKINPRG